MSLNTMTTIYAGLGIAKLNLQIHMASRLRNLPNTTDDYRWLLKPPVLTERIHIVLTRHWRESPFR